jgi:hypothetical protein
MMQLKRFMKYKFWLKAAISIVLVFITSKIHLLITQPCKNPVGWMCDYYIGFPVPFFLHTDVMSMMIAPFLIGFPIDFFIWFIAIRFIFWKLNKV